MIRIIILLLVNVTVYLKQWLCGCGCPNLWPQILKSAVLVVPFTFLSRWQFLYQKTGATDLCGFPRQHGMTTICQQSCNFLFVCPTQCCLFIYFDCQSFMTFWFPFVESELGGKSYTGEEECWNKLFGPYLQFSSFLESAKDPTSSIKMDFSLIAFGPPKTGNNPCWLSMGYKTELVLLMRTARQLGRGWWWAEATNWHLFLACNAPSVRSPSKGSPAETHYF